MRFLKPFAFVLLASFAYAQRLPDTATPHHYILKFTPDLKAATFGGEETIHGDINRPTREITLNALEIEFHEVTVQSLPGGKVQTAQVRLDDQKEMATFVVTEELPKGPVEIKIKFTGNLNDKLRGFYLGHANGRNYASTQFEPTDARRAFPSWDEPAYKAPFDVSIVVNNGDTAISNGSIVKDEPGPGAGQHTITFSQTPKMSTYLLALAVGDFKCLEGNGDGIPIRVCATPDKVNLGKYAVTAAEQIMTFYNHYYDAKYPFKKLDIVAVPDFEAGAMENTAAIYYRETLLLIPDNASVKSKQEVFGVLAHEMAHQWFGDLVTMSWWNDIWLNEGFATWMATKPQRQYHADWKPELDEVKESLRAKSTDSLKSTRPIRQKATSSAEINELFDAIAYEKTAAVLRMIEGYVGEEAFQKGINLYIKEHSYANAAAEDFWGAITRVSGKPVDKIMSAFVNQAGLPLVAGNKQGNGLELRERRYTYDRQAFEGGFPEVWPIPVCTRAAGRTRDCELLSGKSQAVSGKDSVTLNADGRGYYRSALNNADVKPSQLTPGERMTLLDDEWALVRVGQRQVSDFMELSSKFGNERDAHVMDVLTHRIEVISDDLVANGDRAAFETWVSKLLTPAAKELGWEASANEPDERRALRQEVIYALGYAGNDSATIQRAKEEVRKLADGMSKLDANMAETAVNLAARNGDAQIFNTFLAQMKEAKSPEEYYRYLDAFPEFRDPALVERALRLLLSSEMRNQDAPHYLGTFYLNPDARNPAWEFTKEHWAEMQHHMTTWGGGTVVASTRAFCDAKLRNEVPQFFATHKVPAAERALAQSTEQMDYCIDLKAQQGQKLANWLRTSGEKAVVAVR